MNIQKKEKKVILTKDFIRLKNDITVQMVVFMRLIKIKLIKDRKPHKDNNLPDNFKEKWYLYETYSCDRCPNISSCKHKILRFKTTEFNHEMNNS